MRTTDWKTLAPLACMLAVVSCGAGNDLANPPLLDVFGELARLKVGGMEYLVDRDRTLYLEQARSSNQWLRDSRASSAFGFSNAVYWLRFRVENFGRHDVPVFVVIDNEYLDRLDLYGFVRPRTEGSSNETAWDRDTPPGFQKTAGREFSFYAREVPHRKYAFPLKLAAGSQYSFYIAARSRNPMSVPVSVMSEARYAGYWSLEQLRMGVYAGFFSLLLAANFVLFLYFRDKIFLVYAAYLFLNLLYQFSLQGYAFQYIWPTRPTVASNFTTLASCLTVVLALTFARQFLYTRRRLPVFDRFIIICMGLAFFALLSMLVLPAYAVDQFNSLLLIPVCIFASQYAGIRILLQGYRPARLYVFAWGAYSLSLILVILQVYAILPNYLLGVEMLEGLVIGTAIEMLLIPFAIADRIRLRMGAESSSSPAGSESPDESAPATRGASRIARLDKERVGAALHEAMKAQAMYREKITLAALATYLAISEKDLSEFLNEVIGRSFHDYINSFRICEACELLLEERERKIVDIAFAVGFNSLSTFHSVFQKSKGVTPRRFRDAGAHPAPDDRSRQPPPENPHHAKR